MCVCVCGWVGGWENKGTDYTVYFCRLFTKHSRFVAARDVKQLLLYLRMIIQQQRLTIRAPLTPVEHNTKTPSGEVCFGVVW